MELYRRETENRLYKNFLDWVSEAAPYIAHHFRPLTEQEFLNLRTDFGPDVIAACVENLENRRDLRGKYVSLYRTLINWCRREISAHSGT